VIEWTSPEGNMFSRGRWDILDRHGEVTLQLEIASRANPPIPRVLRFAVQKFADFSACRSVDSQLGALRDLLEFPARGLRGLADATS